VFPAGQLLGSYRYAEYYRDQAGRGWNFGWTGTAIYSYYIYTSNKAVLGFMGKTDYYTSTSE